MAGAGNDIYVTAAFRSVRGDDYYLFMKKECVLYARYETGQSSVGKGLLRGPAPVEKVFPCLEDTIFEDAGVDCAFRSHNKNNAFIFAYNECAEFDYAPYGGDDKIVRGPMPISEMFPFLQGTVFENGIDAAFEVNEFQYEAFLFKGDRCARINYGNVSPKIIRIGSITDFFPGLKGRSFVAGLDAACSYNSGSHAFLFKRMDVNQVGTVKADPNVETYAYPATTVNYLFGQVGKLLPRKKSAAS